MHIDTNPAEPTLATTNVSKTISPSTIMNSIKLDETQQLLTTLCLHLMGIDFPFEIFKELFSFIQNLYPQHKQKSDTYNEWLVPLLTENILQTSDDNMYWLLTALYCTPNDEYRITCTQHISHVAAKLALMFMYFDKQQPRLSSKIIQSMADTSSLLASTVCHEFHLDSADFTDHASFEIAVRLKVVFFAHDKINDDLLKDLTTASEDQIYHSVDGINLLNIFLQHANQYMIAMPQLELIGPYRGHISLITSELLTKLGRERLAILLKKQTAQGTNCLHLLAMFPKIDFLLDIFAKHLDRSLLADEITRPDKNRATAFHYACYYGNVQFIKFACQHVDPARLRSTSEVCTSSHGFNALHL
ncbi:MAG: ankyrin repeat domain-containing protein, partial [Pseudomonadota bacterium]|nr:ankyrin repeat domain-containing protein [Pseudomonadota bacterium]